MQSRLELVRPAAIRAARAMLGWDNEELALRAGLSRNTVQAMSAADELNGTLRSLKAAVAALEDAGIIFINDAETGAYGVMLRQPQPEAGKKE